MFFLSSTNRNPSLFLSVCGPSGSGKTTLVDMLCLHGVFERPLSYTTRRKRENEGNNEYSFLSKENFLELHGVNFDYYDEVYGNYYAVDKLSIFNILESNRIPIKEIALENVENIQAYNGIQPIAVYLPQSFVSRADRKEENSFQDIEVPTLYLNSCDVGVNSILSWVRLIELFVDYFGLDILNEISIEDQVNKIGYDLVAPFFSDKHRVTTRTFHEMTYEFWSNTLLSLQGDVLEVGPGSGWLRKAFDWPEVVYSGIDISECMLYENPDRESIQIGSLSHFGSNINKYDAIVGSLIDPCFSPQNLPHIFNALKPGGRFFGTVPAGEWSSRIRSQKGFAEHQTQFSIPQGTATVQSYCLTCDQILEILNVAGFKDVSVQPILYQNSFELPHDIKIAIGKEIKDIPILHAWECTKYEK